MLSTFKAYIYIVALYTFGMFFRYEKMPHDTVRNTFGSSFSPVVHLIFLWDGLRPRKRWKRTAKEVSYWVKRSGRM